MEIEIVTICVSFIAAIVGIAYPILLEVISRLDEKYSSLVILDLFSEEKEKKYFTWLLYLSLVSILIWICEFPQLINIPGLNYFIGHSAHYILLFFTIFLIYFFIGFVNKVLLYYTPLKFLPYLIDRHKNRKNEDDFIFFSGISDLLYYSIKNQNEAIAKTISGFMYDEYKGIRDINSNKEVIYKQPYYELITKTIEELATQKNKRLTFLEHRTAGSVWLLGEHTNSKVSERTYAWMWRNLQLALTYERDDYIIYHWENAFEYIRSSLEYIEEEYSYTLPIGIINQAQVDQRVKERKRFLEFHYALGGLLYYKGRYKCIDRCFKFTHSIPPQYELLPDTMDDVFGLYFNFKDPYEMSHSWISSKYSFPEMSGLQADYRVKKWICGYVAILFLRQYTIVPHLITMKPLDLPASPTTQGEKRIWLDNIDYFKTLVEEALKNEYLLKTLELDFITDDWCDTNKKRRPLDFIDSVKDKVSKAFTGTLIGQPISETKAELFKETTERILSTVLSEYDVVSNKDLPIGEVEKLYINGINYVISKSAFADDVDSSNLNFDSFLSSSLATKYRDAVSEIFFRLTSERYLLSKDDIIPAIKRLNATPNEYVIVSFGRNFPEINSNDVKGFDIINFEYRNFPLVGDSIFILKKSDLPYFNYKVLPEKEIDKYSLHLLIDRFKIYTSLIDLNLANELRESIKDDDDKDLRQSVYVGIFMSVEILWKKGIRCIQLQKESFFREGGIKNKLTDVKPIVVEPDKGEE